MNECISDFEQKTEGSEYLQKSEDKIYNFELKYDKVEELDKMLSSGNGQIDRLPSIQTFIEYGSRYPFLRINGWIDIRETPTLYVMGFAYTGGTTISLDESMRAEMREDLAEEFLLAPTFMFERNTVEITYNIMDIIR